MLWLTKRIVRPSPVTSRILPRLLRWNSASPTDNTSSTSRTSGSRCAATAKANRMYMPLEYRFTGVSMNFPTPANSTISSYLAPISDRLMPRIAPFKKMLSRPVSSGWKPVPTSSSDASRPLMSAYPAVGSVMRERIFSSVLLPAPLRPMMPSTWPCSSSNETSLRAQIVSTLPPRTSARRRAPGCVTRSWTESRIELVRSTCEIL